MKLNLKIEEDEILRKEIRSMIKGQVLSVAREEIRGIVKEAFDSKFEMQTNPGNIIKEVVRSYVLEFLKKKKDWRSPTNLENITRDVVAEEFKNFYTSKS